MAAKLVLIVLALVPVVAPERLSDNDIKQLFDRIDNDRDRFEDQLDGKLKQAVLRGPGGEIDVERYLDDLQKNVDRLKERFNSGYSASAEVTTVLRQGSDIQRYMATQPPNFKGASEWNRFAAGLNELAAAYGTGFPIGAAATARRMNDREVKQAAEELGDAAERLKDALESTLRTANTVDTALPEATVAWLEALKNTARTLASRVGRGQPASGEAKALIEHFVALRAASERHLSLATTEWASVRGQVATVALGFALEVPASTR
jgi:hypothetical protein